MSACSSDQLLTRRRLLMMVFPVIIIWGLNFAVMKFGVTNVGPFLLGSMRFTLAAVPLVFFIRRPNIPFRYLVFYAFCFGFLQFAFLFHAISLGFPTGMSSLFLQFQAFFTPVLGFLFLNDKIGKGTLYGICLGLVGVCVIGIPQFDEIQWFPLSLVLVAATGWALSNIVVRKISTRNASFNPMALIVWASALLPVPFMFLAWQLGELETVTLDAIKGALLPAVYLGYAATLGAYYFWVKSIALYGATVVAPFSLLIPMIGMITGIILFGETVSIYDLTGAALIILGVGLHIRST